MVESLLMAPFSKSKEKTHRGRGGPDSLAPQEQACEWVPSPPGLARKDGWCQSSGLRSTSASFGAGAPGFCLEAAGLSLPLLADAWGASGLPQDLCSLPACGTLELKMWLLITQAAPHLAMHLHTYTALHTHTAAARHSTRAAPHLLPPPPSALLFPSALLLPLQDHATATGVSGKEGATASVHPRPRWQCWHQEWTRLSLFHLAQCSPDHLCWPFHSPF